MSTRATTLLELMDAISRGCECLATDAYYGFYTGPVAPSAHLDTAVALLEVAFGTKFTASKNDIKHNSYIIHTADSPICRYQN